MDIQEVKAVAENLGRAFEEFKATQAENLKKADSLHEEKMTKIAEELGEKLELLQKNQAALEAAAKRPAMGEAKEVEAKTSQVFNEFLKKGSHSAAERGFEGYVADKNIDVKALSVNINQDGGFLVPTAFGGVIATRVFESSPVRQFANVVTIGTADYEVVLDNDEAAAGWVNETAARPATNTPTIDKRLIPTHEMYANPKATQKILDDGVVNIEQWLAGKVADRLARLESTAFVSGNGVGKPMGILTNLTASTSFDPRNVQTVKSGTSGVFTYAGLVDLQNALKEPYQGNAIFMAKRASFGSLMKIVDGQSRPIFNLMFDKNTGIATSIMGKQLVFADDVPAVAADANALIYGDFRAGYTIVDRAGIRVLRDPYTDKPFVTFYTTKRVGGDVVNSEAFKVQVLSA
jgi:HK97 family phage major capsid protein